MSKRTMAALAALALALGAGGCSGGKESRREEERSPAASAGEPTTPMTGIVSRADGQRVMLEPADVPSDEPLLFERTTRSVVIRDGREVSWNELQEGDAVRVTWDRGIFGPDRVVQIEVLSGREAEEVRERVEDEMDVDDQGIGDPMEPRPIDPGTDVPTDPTLPPAPVQPGDPGGREGF